MMHSKINGTSNIILLYTFLENKPVHNTDASHYMSHNETHAWLPKFDALHSFSSNAMQGLVSNCKLPSTTYTEVNQQLMLE